MGRRWILLVSRERSEEHGRPNTIGNLDKAIIVVT